MEKYVHDVFISYSRNDYVDENGNVIPDNWLTKIKDAFDANGISYWFDEDGIYSGDEFASVLTKAIRKSGLFLFISSKNSNQSLWTSNEISAALEYKKVIIPFRIDDSPYNDSVMMKIVSLDYIECQDEEKAIKKLVIAVKHHMSGSPLSSKYLWRTIDVPDRARGTKVSFQVGDKWQEQVFVYDDSIGKFKKIQTPKNVSVQKFINEKKLLTEQQCWQLLHDVAKGLAFLHSQTPPIPHQEITPGAIIVKEDGHYTITDYDISSESCISCNTIDTVNSHNNSLRYMPPERFDHGYIPILASDIWSLGAVMYHLMTGSQPFGDYEQFIQMEGDELPKIEGNYSPRLKAIVYKCLSVNPWERPRAEDLILLKQSSSLLCPNCGNEMTGDVCKRCGLRVNSNGGVRYTSVTYPQHRWGRTCCARRNMSIEHAPRPLGIPQPACSGEEVKQPSSLSIFSKIKQLFRKRPFDYQAKPLTEKAREDMVLSSVFAPAEVKRKSHMLIQVYLHLPQEAEKVKQLAKESQENAKRRDYIPLQCYIEKGDKVDVQLNIYGESLLMTEKKTLVWQGTFTKSSFDYFVQTDIDVDDLSCMVQLSVNDIPVGEMRFVTKIVETPRELNPEIIAHRYQKVFISYAHQDEARVKFFPEGLKLTGTDYFFDRHYLQAGDIYPKKIQDYIDSADLFVLFWSENASKSEYVRKELAQALERAFPKVKSTEKSNLSIYPMSIEPRAELPSDMKDNFHFGEM